MKNEVTIRPARNHDAKKIFQFLCEQEGHLFDQHEFEVNYRLCLSDNNNIYLVAADADRDAIGFIGAHGQILLHEGGMVYEIQELFVENAYRNKNIGKMLLKTLEEYLAKRDYKKFEVATNKTRSDTIRFYLSSGFEETHVRLMKPRKRK